MKTGILKILWLFAFNRASLLEGEEGLIPSEMVRWGRRAIGGGLHCVEGPLSVKEGTGDWKLRKGSEG